MTTHDGTRPPWPAGSFDRVLVDAPCSGLGALRRRPEARWRRQPEDLRELVPLQRALLDAAVDLVRPGGVVLYATCSPVVAETSDVVSSVLVGRDDVRLEPVPLALPDAPRPLRGDDPAVAAPARHGCDVPGAAATRVTWDGRHRTVSRIVGVSGMDRCGPPRCNGRDGPGPGPRRRDTSMRRAAVVLVLALATLTLTRPASAGDVVVVPGTVLPRGRHLPQLVRLRGPLRAHRGRPERLGRARRRAPLGSRATRLAMPATGQASGPVTRVDDVAAAGWSLWVRPVSGGRGVAHVWYVSGDLDEGEVWSGRADLTAAAGTWQQVDPAAATFSWSRLAAATGKVLEQSGDATLARFTRTHGDGPGYLLAGFGCDGEPFLIDGVEGGGTTYDLEGLPVSTTIEASQHQVAPGTEVTLTGETLEDDGVATGAALVLEARPRERARSPRSRRAGARPGRRLRGDHGDAREDHRLPLVHARDRLRRRRLVAGDAGARRTLRPRAGARLTPWRRRSRRSRSTTASSR